MVEISFAKQQLRGKEKVMNAKHLTKNAMSHKLVFLAVGIAIAIITAFSICATSQAKASVNKQSNDICNWTLQVQNSSDFKLLYSYNDAQHEYGFDVPWENNKKINDYLTGHIKNNATSCNCAQWKDSYDGQYIYSMWLNFEGNTKEAESNDFVGFIKFDVVSESSLEFSWYFDNKELPLVEPSEESPEVELKHLTEEDLKSTLSFYGGEDVPTSGVNISGQVWDAQTDMPVPFANVVYCQYNPWWGRYIPVEGVEPVKTDMWGWYTIEGITEEMLPGKVFVYDGIKKIGESEPIWFLPEDMETLWLWPIVINQHDPDINLADVEINGGQHHTNFVTTYELVKDGKVVESDGGTFNKIEYKVPVGSSYAVYDDGTLHCSYAFDENGTSSSVAYTVKAVAEEGYVLDKWNINGEDLIPGKDYILKANDVMGLASYKLAEQPVPPVPPAPGPTPVNPGGGIAQTGDNTGYALVIFAMVALLGAGVLTGRKLYSR